ncbi:MAG: sulfur carrier protein ThiS [Acidobacteria bacterium]|nr:sulfur carrier protein ThiS [Acidobacteriota bacterium]
MESQIVHPERVNEAGSQPRRIFLNGDPYEIAPGSTVRDLLDALELGVERVAVEVDRRIVRRDEWAARELAPGAVVEVVHFVGGG